VKASFGRNAIQLIVVKTHWAQCKRDAGEVLSVVDACWAQWERYKNALTSYYRRWSP